MAGELLTTDGQVEWRGTLLGPGTPFGTVKITGLWDLPGQRGGNPPLPGFHGSYLGQRLSTDRQVTWDFKTKTARADFAGAIATLRAITAPDENPGNEPLYVQLDGLAMMVNARVTGRAIPTDVHYSLGYSAGSIAWEANDPRVYGRVEKSTSTRLAVAAGGGLDFGGGGLDFGGGGLAFGAGVTGGQCFALNAGHVPTWPRFEVDGPTLGPQILYGGRALQFDPAWSLLAGQTLRIDTAPGRRTVEVNGVNVRQRLFTAQWTALQGNENTRIQFLAGAYNAAAELRPYWRDAYQ
ncbi:hypothetical protein [Amycolatopsis sp. H20-H5]|uniref:hypothetical protein n=1 Tax=Amycolatopsis sp. H20-H5 TaxID=3046309 RepID=UPI002DB6E1CA|nr:hypothetical protein [Amycolatopsis sp. H20-H5]MEC3977909.1 hypothetical protein [Amycolatopsis sp. H20-H5]